MFGLSQELFPDSNFRSLIENVIPETGFEEWVDSITYIAVPNKNIESLKGIELFSNLEILEASYNHIRSLDLSHNTKLRELYVNENEMEHLIVPDHLVLQKLHCIGNQLAFTKPIKALKIVKSKEDLIKPKKPIRKKIQSF